jgi:hypothetical protein
MLVFKQFLKDAVPLMASLVKSHSIAISGRTVVTRLFFENLLTVRHLIDLVRNDQLIEAIDVSTKHHVSLMSFDQKSRNQHKEILALNHLKVLGISKIS